MTDDEDYLQDTLFFDLADPGALDLDESMATLSGKPVESGPYPTPLIEQCCRAWRTPFRDLTCDDVMSLIGQGIGPEWLAKPLLDFVRRYPDVMISFYAGDLTLQCLREAKELSAVAGAETRAWLEGDFAWIERVYGWDRTGALLADVRRALASARDLARLQ